MDIGIVCFLPQFDYKTVTARLKGRPERVKAVAARRGELPHPFPTHILLKRVRYDAFYTKNKSS
ncbi:hypothetical protein GCM10011339_09070 [Echinicola rosea]|uniref:Uncharacterized protein n=1 Tax=Echinicola rosea TaxID=1807691 RepID=A0ABQ1UNA5_9BACT|nr:hypothetical protein GCM10011339_09070 [Echinicola rosea]